MSSNYLLLLVNETIHQSLTSFTNFPISSFLIFTFFMTESLIGISSVKMLFLVGFLILFSLFYSIGTILFPFTQLSNYNETNIKENEIIDINFLRKLIPFTDVTSISFICVFVAYIMMFFISLNIHFKQGNWITNIFMYSSIIVSFSLYYVFLFNGDIQTTIMSLSFGIFFGILWSLICINGNYIKKEDIDNIYDKSKQSCETDHENQNESIICRNFRM